jgi:hypothetical protein
MWSEIDKARFPVKGFPKTAKQTHAETKAAQPKGNMVNTKSEGRKKLSPSNASRSKAIPSKKDFSRTMF